MSRTKIGVLRGPDQSADFARFIQKFGLRCIFILLNGWCHKHISLNIKVHILGQIFVLKLWSLDKDLCQSGDFELRFQSS